MKAHIMPLRSRQSGAILVVSLLLLLVMTALALTASQTTRLQERMAGNARDLDLAFQGAEAGLRDAEGRLSAALEAASRHMIDMCPSGCPALGREITPIDFLNDDTWLATAVPYGDASTQEFTDLASEPVHRTELWINFKDSLTDGAKPGQQTGTAYFATTSYAEGGTDTARVILQSVFAAPYVE